MASMEDLLIPTRFGRRVTAKAVVGLANTGIDLVNLGRDMDAQFKPIDVDEDVFGNLADIKARAIGSLAGEEKGKQAKEFLLRQTRAPETFAGEMTENTATFLLGFLGGRKLVQGGVSAISNGRALSQAGQWGVGAVAGGLTDFTLADTDANARLTNFIPDEYRPAFLDYLAADPSEDESRLEARFKNALEGAALGSAIDGLFAVVRGIRGSAIARGVGNIDDIAQDLEAAAGIPMEETRALMEAQARKRVADYDVDMDPRNYGSTEAPRPTVDVPNIEKQISGVLEASLDAGQNLESAVAHSINLLNVNLGDLVYTNTGKAWDIIENVAKNLEDVVTTRKVRKHKEIFEMAQAEGIHISKDLEKLQGELAKLQGDIAKASPKLLLFRQMFAKSATDLVPVAQKIARGIDISDATMREFTERVKLHATLQAGVEGSSSEAGVLLNSLKIKANGLDLDFDMDKAFGGRTLTESEERTLMLLRGSEADHKDLVELARQVSNTGAIDPAKILGGLKGHLKFLSVLKGIRVRNMLSGLPTHAVGTISNALHTGLIHLVENPISSLMASNSQVDRITLMGSLEGVQRAVKEPFLMGERFFQHYSQNLSGVKGVRNKTREAFKELSIDGTSRFREELGNFDIRWNDSHFVAKLWNSWADVMDIVSLGSMEFVDSVAKNVNFSAEVGNIARTRGITKGLKGSDLKNYVDQQLSQARALATHGPEAENHLFNTLAARGVDTTEAARHVVDLKTMAGQAQETAKRAVFQDAIQDPTLKGLETLLNQESTLSSMVKTFILPFYRTPVKLVTFWSDHTPILNKASKWNREALQGVHGPRAQQRLRAQVLTGSAMYTMAGGLVATGQITGKHRADERESLLASGVPEYSVRIPNTDKWISYQRADPFGMFLGITADVHTVVKDADDGGELAAQAASGVISALVSNVTSKTFMKGLSDFLKATENPSGFGSYWADSQVRATVPTLVSFQRTFEKVWNANAEEYRKQKPDEGLTEISQWVDILVGESGFTRKSYMRDALGNKVKRSGIVGEVLGFRATETTDSPALREMARLKRFPSNRELTFDTGFKMRPDEFQTFKEILGDQVGVTERLNAVVQDPRYKALGNVKRSKVLDSIIRKSRKAAKVAQLRADPELLEEVKAHHKDRLMKAFEQTERDLSKPKTTLEDILEQRRDKSVRK